MLVGFLGVFCLFMRLALGALSRIRSVLVTFSTNSFVFLIFQASRYEHVLENDNLISQPKHIRVGTQKNRLNKTVLLSTQNT